jgi:hypothetical protein
MSHPVNPGSLDKPERRLQRLGMSIDTDIGRHRDALISPEHAKLVEREILELRHRALVLMLAVAEEALVATEPTGIVLNPENVARPSSPQGSLENSDTGIPFFPSFHFEAHSDA